MSERPRPTVRGPRLARPTVRRSMGASLRRTRTVRRASAGLSPVRAGAILVALVSSAAVYGVVNSSAFTFANVAIEGATFTDETAVAASLEGARGQNLFQLVTRPLEDEIRTVPSVRRAEVSVRLPDTLVVRIQERSAILVWRIGARRYLVDIDGSLFSRLVDEPPEAVATLPVVEDRRAASVGLSVGRVLDRVDLDAATRLASLAPSDVGSEADGLLVYINDANGFTLRARPAGWTAVFGFYTPTLRTPELVPGQVRLLRSLLIGREPLLERIILASETDGTYTTRPTPSPSATPAP